MLPAFGLEQSEVVACYVRNDHLGFGIPYEYTGVSHSYEPDFIVKLKNDVHLILEIKGFETEQERAKHTAARRWVLRSQQLGTILENGSFHVCKDPQQLRHELAFLARDKDS